MNRTLVALAMLAVAAVSAFAQTANLPKMDVDFSFEQKHKCQGVSPEIRLGNVPTGVVSYDVKLTGANFTPASSEVAVDPSSPPTTTRVAEANAAACTASVDGVTSVAVSPPSAVRTSWSPCSVVMTHNPAVAQRIEVRFALEPANALAFHVAPPSVVFRNTEPSPTA